MDFTFSTYRQLLAALKSGGYSFQTFADFIRNPKDKVVVMRHDVDRLPENALKMARIEHGMGIAASYYFRAVPVSWDEGIIREIAGMGHEVGYHYENLESVVSSQWSVVGKIKTRRKKSFVRPSEPPAGTPRELVHQVKQKNRFNPAGRAGESALIGPSETPQRGPRFHKASANEELNMSFADRKAHYFIASGEGGYGVRSRLHHL